MSSLKTALVQGALIASMAVGVIAATASTASADVACNRNGECWRVYNHYDYPPTVGVTVRGDDWWAGHPSGHWRWRGPQSDRGYYRNGIWISL